MKLEEMESGKKPTEWKRLLLSGVSIEFANAVRRAIISEVETLAIEDAKISDNSSALYDEMLSLRLGLVPIVTPKGEFVRKDKCDCKGAGCHKCTVVLTLKKKGPGMVYSGDLVSDHTEAKPAFDRIPLTLLNENQAVDIECIAVLGSGKEHAKFQPALCTYIQTVTIKVGKNVEKPEELAEICPSGVFIKKEPFVKAPEKCTLCNLCVEKKGVTVTPNEKEFVFYIESFGQRKVSDIVAEAAETLEAKAKEFAEKL